MSLTVSVTRDLSAFPCTWLATITDDTTGRKVSSGYHYTEEEATTGANSLAACLADEPNQTNP